MAHLRDTKPLPWGASRNLPNKYAVGGTWMAGNSHSMELLTCTPLSMRTLGVRAACSEVVRWQPPHREPGKDSNASHFTNESVLPLLPSFGPQVGSSGRQSNTNPCLGKTHSDTSQTQGPRSRRPTHLSCFVEREFETSYSCLGKASNEKMLPSTWPVDKPGEHFS